jgi:hypothetical protein
MSGQVYGNYAIPFAEICCQLLPDAAVFQKAVQQHHGSALALVGKMQASLPKWCVFHNQWVAQKYSRCTMPKPT